MDELLIITMRGIGLGAVYSVIAYAFNAVYNATAVLNLAQGHLLVLGGLVAAETVSAETPILAWLGLALLAGLLLAVVTAAQGVVTLAPLRSASEQWSWLVTTLAVSVIIDALITRTRGPSAAVVPDVLGQVGVLGTRMPITYIATLALSIVSFAVLALFYRRTRTGLALSAMAQDFDAARANGIAVRRLQIVAFAVSGALLGIGGFVGARALSLTPISGLGYVVSGFIACVVGGLGNDRGALIAGPLVGVVTMLAAYQFGGQWQTVAALAVLIVVLMIRPRGLFGSLSVRAV